MLQSCRNDYLNEQHEAYYNSSAFKLTLKTISLQESNHFDKLSTELQKAEQTFKTLKTNISGKVVSYGNGVSIDTDDVIYIENGPGFHTYTFRINRENAPADAPVENLVLSPLSDGTWKETLITYTLTEQEKQIMLSGGAVNLHGKISYTVLENNTYSTGIMQKDDGCYWQVNSYYTWCSEGYHNHGELSTDDGGPCKAEAQSVLVISADWKCPSDGGGAGSGAGPGNPTGDGDNGSSDGGGTGDGSSQPCGGNGVPTQPQSPTTEIGQNDCNDGTPTVPNLGGHPKNNPCENAKNPVNNANNILNTATISTEMNALKQYAANDHYEYGTAIINTGTTVIAQDPYSNNDPNDPGHVGITVPPVGDYLASAHTHPNHGAAPPSVKDLYNTLGNSKEYLTFQSSFVFSSNGTIYAFVVTDREKAIAFLAAYPLANNTTNEGRIFNDSSAVGKDFLNILENYMVGRLPAYSGNSQDDGIESAYASILEKYNSGINLAKIDSNGNLKPLRSVAFQYEIPASGGKTIIGYKAVPCP